MSIGGGLDINREQYRAPPMSSTLLNSMPRSVRAARVAAMSSTTRWKPLTEPWTPSVIEPIPVPKTMAQLDPGGLSCTISHRFRDLGCRADSRGRAVVPPHKARVPWCEQLQNRAIGAVTLDLIELPAERQYSAGMRRFQARRGRGVMYAPSSRVVSERGLWCGFSFLCWGPGSRASAVPGGVTCRMSRRLAWWRNPVRPLGTVLSAYRRNCLPVPGALLAALLWLPASRAVCRKASAMTSGNRP
jgi:hypothetical protein